MGREAQSHSSPWGWQSRHSWECFLPCSPPLSYAQFCFQHCTLCNLSLTMWTLLKVLWNISPNQTLKIQCFLSDPTTGKSRITVHCGGVLLMPFLQNWGPLKHAQMAHCPQRASPLLLPNTSYFKAFHFEKQSPVLLWWYCTILSREIHPGVNLGENYLSCLIVWRADLWRSHRTLLFRGFSDITSQVWIKSFEHSFHMKNTILEP